MPDDTIQRHNPLFQALIEHSPDAIILMKPDGNITYANPSTQQVCGYATTEFIGMNGITILHPDDQARIRTILSHLLNHPGATATAEFRTRCKNGSFHWIEGTFVNSLDDPNIGALTAHYHKPLNRKPTLEYLTRNQQTTAKQPVTLPETRQQPKPPHPEQRTLRALNALLKVAQAMVYSPDLNLKAFEIPPTRIQQVAQQTAELIYDILGCERLSLFQVEPETEQVHPLAVIGLTDEQEQVWQDEQAYMVAHLADGLDPTQIERLRRREVLIVELDRLPWVNSEGIHTTLIAPLHLKKQLFGLIQLDYQQQTHIYTSDEIALTQAASQLVSLIIEREYLLTANQGLSELIELAHDAVVVRDPESHILFWNQGAETLYGWNKQEALGQVIHTLLATHFPLSQEDVETILAKDSQWQGILTHTCRDGKEVTVESRQVLVRPTVGGNSAILEINRDITEQEQLLRERTLAQMNEIALREANRLMDEFLGIAGHELRTPLTTIKASIQLAQRQLNRLHKQTPLPEQTSHQITLILAHLDRTMRQVAMQSRLVSDLLDVSRIQSNRLELHPEPCNLVQLLEDAVADHQSTLPERHLTFTSTISGDSLVMADPDRILQVVNNYLSNALKYSDVTKPVNIGAETVGTDIRVWVQDEGAGLTLEQQQHIWERFYRVPDMEIRSGSVSGLGLGLHISRVLIERQSGHVGLQSEHDKGSTFWFTLPKIQPQ